AVLFATLWITFALRRSYKHLLPKFGEFIHFFCGYHCEKISRLHINRRTDQAIKRQQPSIKYIKNNELNKQKQNNPQEDKPKGS
ncbi:hypothetical protein, partial [Plesiomonas sp.]|uniref:hypothetical protein n=1 Tax=Plesiomonas sp. TaxID=2486279 RepID=UPI003F2AC14A